MQDMEQVTETMANMVQEEEIDVTLENMEDAEYHGTGRGRYRGYGNYSEGEEMLEDMKESYGAYNESMNAYSRGNYGAGEDGMKALEETMELFTDFTEKMVEQAESPEEKQIVKKYLKKVGQMGG